MSEITKLYENAGVKAINIAKNGSTYIPDYIQISGHLYPPFTAEKQIKILCFIVNNKHSVTFHDQIFGGDKLTPEKIQKNLAWGVNRIWHSLTSEEKQQVKGILE